MVTHRNGLGRRYFATELPEHISPMGRRFVLGRLGTRFSLASDTPRVSTHVREMTELVMKEGNLYFQKVSRLCWACREFEYDFYRCDTVERGVAYVLCISATFFQPARSGSHLYPANRDTWRAVQRAMDLPTLVGHSLWDCLALTCCMDYTIFTFNCQGHEYQIYIIFTKKRHRR